MKISLKAVQLAKEFKNCHLVGVFEDSDFTPSLKEMDRMTQSYISKIRKSGGFAGKLGSTLPLFSAGGSKIEQILLLGCGKIKDFKANNFREATFRGIRALIDANVTDAICYLVELPVQDLTEADKVRHIAEVAGEAKYRFDLFKSQKEPKIVLRNLTIAVPAKQQKTNEAALNQGLAIAEGVTFTKNLANLPSNICTPTFLADQAKDLAKTYKHITTNILNENAMRKLGMGALLAVSQGSAEEAKLIVVEYRGDKKNKPPVALVGKGITFDTGGISLKPNESMFGMKYDMCGAATVLGTIKAAAELKLPVNIVGVIAAVENMPGGTAYKPEDILTSMSGITIEVTNTDAEGRLVLCDALTYCKRYKPDVVIDIATLTGAVVIALGFHATALLSNDDALAKDLLNAGTKSHDRAWQLPLWDDYQEQIKSPFADIANTGGRPAGTITAACFLSRFTKDLRWAHLDVAGTAATMLGTTNRKASGRPVPMLMQYLIDRVDA